MDDVELDHGEDPLKDVVAGLLDASGQQLPLQAVHVKCKLVDLLSQVIIFQKYTNRSAAPIEAKYVFPLDAAAAVCGFEAFINGKHVVAQVKEKEAARKEYKQAVEKGHGAYLLDQDAPVRHATLPMSPKHEGNRPTVDVFTISVGNLPPGATVLIKVTFVSELIVRDGSVVFSLPGSVAPWRESAALNQTTQRTDCKAVVSVLPGELMGRDGFELSITLSEVHLPRMWVEQHPDKDSQASMLVFYPDFEVDSSPASDEVVLLVDSSESMKGEPLRAALRIARRVLGTLDPRLKVNVIFFSTDHTDAFPTARPLAEALPAADDFLKLPPPAGGSTELWRPLRALGLLPPSRGVRNLLLLSDGHVQNAELALRLLRDDARHSRLFTCGLSPTANRHMLRALAQAGGGAYEYFDTKTKHNWAEKVACQVKRMASPGCSSVSVKWQQFNRAAPPPVQAPRLLTALFNDCHTLVYGFVPHCTQATLLGNLSGQELKTMVMEDDEAALLGCYEEVEECAGGDDDDEDNDDDEDGDDDDDDDDVDDGWVDEDEERPQDRFSRTASVDASVKALEIHPFSTIVGHQQVSPAYEATEGYWELTAALGDLLDFNVDLFANEFLKNQGIRSLGEDSQDQVQVLQGEPVLPARWAAVKLAVDWVCWADRQYPCVCSRLEFGRSWETSTRQLLGLQAFQGLPPSSALRGLKLQRAERRLLGF
ncbi:Poly [ADP-ribose] polymerase 4 [Liparis tanakae]|uniref:Poly [ADP-ribose] polymerase 4 n=1 Tax=Liparis tanakae TaxID=230148 RepID=A0A4Z2F523_9TELE|nr:Poly [ADP-ribose] polymerase 4 [Liparis tanakae]